MLLERGPIVRKYYDFNSSVRFLIMMRYPSPTDVPSSHFPAISPGFCSFVRLENLIFLQKSTSR